eukprot:gnl/MRDRNA2_/MRDRNA2_62873_c0_seq1.p1 gnl/MRDRNA2_/MRDRNA2_62873_c0~~gnl/MRDRNA2_/MRDRNA2_62873_c0_seq1.p1  ORF type:complete len:120 (+),score=23.24 gnl/MRDRNA2_/MRDRNA2_62873_c0_seq1:110-469(+)
MNVARFATRAAGVSGFPPVAAQLADPNAIPATKWVPSIDIFIRHIVSLLLSGSDAADRAKAIAEVNQTVVSLPVGDRETVAKCLQYLQRRIGVPRDMSQPAAICLRMELQNLVQILRHT